MEWTQIVRADQGPLVIWGTYPFSPNSFEHMRELLMQEGLSDKLTLAAFEVQNWDVDFSPWENPDQLRERPFAGNAPATLKMMDDELIPSLRQSFGADRPLWIMGYSLAGLFALWAAYETNIFEGVCCCSGSLWFDAWDAYAQAHQMRRPCNVYMSLGGKEAETSDPVLATVASCTRAQLKHLKSDPMVMHAVLDMNKGGHFADSEKRLIKGLQWLLSC